ncbi:MAG: FAD-binding oxidoreductase [Thaumarchaeota archaeon]|nr:FAD-binding oxidoreductase [Nitrososphaerota archaeon]
MQGASAGKPIVVVGAGSTGSSTAYHLAKAGQRVVLVDRGQIANGTTSRSSAVVRTHYSNEVVARMALYSRDVLKDFSSVGESGFNRTGMLILAPPEIRETVLGNIAMLNGIGARNDFMEIPEAMEAFPEFNYDDIGFAVLEPESGYADPVGVANSYARSAERQGAQLLLGTEVSRLKAPSGTVESVELSDGSQIECSKVMLCTNVWTNELLARSGVAPDRFLPIWAVGHPMVAFNRPASYHGNRPVVWDYPQKTYYKPEGRYLVYVGTVDSALDQRHSDPAQVSQDVGSETLESFTGALVTRMPLMAEGVLHSTYVGMYDVTPDQHPIIDELSELGLSGVFCCAGLSGHGFKLSPALGLMNAEMVMGETGIFGRTFDRSIFALSRFKEGKEMRAKYPGMAAVA